MENEAKMLFYKYPRLTNVTFRMADGTNVTIERPPFQPTLPPSQRFYASRQPPFEQPLPQFQRRSLFIRRLNPNYSTQVPAVRERYDNEITSEVQNDIRRHARRNVLANRFLESLTTGALSINEGKFGDFERLEDSESLGRGLDDSNSEGLREFLRHLGGVNLERVPSNFREIPFFAIVSPNSEEVRDNPLDEETQRRIFANIREFKCEGKESSACSICQETIKNRDRCAFLECAHIFHERCIKELVKVRSDCPNCRTIIS